MERLKFLCALVALGVIMGISDSGFGDTVVGTVIALAAFAVVVVYVLSSIFGFMWASKKTAQKAHEQLDEALRPLSQWRELNARAAALAAHLNPERMVTLQHECARMGAMITKIDTLRRDRERSLGTHHKISERRRRRIFVNDCRDVAELATKASYQLVAIRRQCDELEPRVMISRQIQKLETEFQTLRSYGATGHTLPLEGVVRVSELLTHARNLFAHDKLTAAQERADMAEKAMEQLANHLSKLVIDHAESLLRPKGPDGRQ